MLKIGVLCPSEIAFRRFMPALANQSNFVCVGYGVSSIEERFFDGEVSKEVAETIVAKQMLKANLFVEEFGGKIFPSYQAMVESPDLDAIYIPLPPALHFQWAKKALQNGKHVLVEKPATLSWKESKELVDIAREKEVGLHENYMFAFHNQLEAISELVHQGKLGDIYLYRIDFGFPKRAEGDFRYNPHLGGGALIDAGGYTLRYASMLLGESCKIDSAKSRAISGYQVDTFGAASLSNANGEVLQLAFGMDNEYRCNLDIWGSKGSLITNRILTAPVGYVPSAELTIFGKKEQYELPTDDTFLKSIDYFYQTIRNQEIREESFRNILKQAELLEDFIKIAEETHG